MARIRIRSIIDRGKAGRAFRNSVGVLLMLIALTSCSKIFAVRASGSLDSQVSFFFFDLSGKPISVDITSVTVKRKTIADWTTVWALKGQASGDRLTYGVDIRGLNESAPAVALQSGSTYMIEFDAKTRLGPNSHASALFGFGSEGAVINQPK